LAADSLFALALEQRGKQEFADSVDNLKLLLNEFGSTASVPKAKELLPQVYLEWGDTLRGEAHFSEAEKVYLSLIEWAQNENDQIRVASTRTELAQIYFDWGMDLQGKNDFELADAKFSEAMSVDPNASDANSITSKTRAYLPDFHRAWGEHLLLQRDFSEAIKQYKTYVNLVSNEDEANAKDLLSQAYLNWASSLRGGGDYYQALDKIKLANESAATDPARGKANTARESTINQFSLSISAQAQEIIASTTERICAKGTPADPYQIIGTLDDKRLTLSGLGFVIPNNILAQSPGSLHFVACGEEKTVKVQSCPYTLIGGYGGGTTYWIERIRYDWVFNVYYARTGKLYQQKTIQGTTPESCPYTHSFSIGNITHYHYGDRPVSETVLKWFESLLK
jgi:tetratricopeptide (TPR) repeat protein